MEDKKEKLMNAWLRLVDTLGKTYLNVHTNGDYFDFTSSKKCAFSEICEFAYETIVEYYKQFDKYVVSEIYVNDCVTLSIDNGTPICYYVTDEPNNDINVLDCKDKNGLGYQLIGKYVGNTFKYCDNESKNEHTVTILANKRTDNSFRVERCVLDAYIEEGKSLSK